MDFNLIGHVLCNNLTTGCIACKCMMEKDPKLHGEMAVRHDVEHGEMSVKSRPVEVVERDVLEDHSGPLGHLQLVASTSWLSLCGWRLHVSVLL